jgi:RNA polymerase sigma-70 factor (ECF subfamily)
MDHADEQQAIAAVLAGDVNAFAMLVERYQRPIFNMAYRMTRSHADALDLAQETFLKAFEELHRFQAGKRFFPWLYCIGMNRSKNFLRRKRILPNISLDDCEPGSGLDYPGQEEQILCEKLDLQVLADALQELPFDYREAVVLRFHEELSMEDVATALNLSLSAAKMRVHRGLKKLRDLIEDRGSCERGKTTSAP